MFLKKPQNKISTWTLWSPIKFAIISLLLMILFTSGYNLWFKPENTTHIGALMAIAGGMGLAIIFYIWRLPDNNLNRYEFVELNTIQMFWANLAFMITTFVVLGNIEIINNYLLSFPNINPGILTILALVGLGYLYILGIFVGNIYAKYRRARAMGVAPWKILLSMPFGFSMLWIAGYMLPDATTKQAKVPARRYARFVTTICKNSIYAYTVLLLLIIMSGLFIGLKFMITVLAMGAIFATWHHVRGTATMRGDITTTYSTVAIIINITMIALAILLTI